MLKYFFYLFPFCGGFLCELQYLPPSYHLRNWYPHIFLSICDDQISYTCRGNRNEMTMLTDVNPTTCTSCPRTTDVHQPCIIPEAQRHTFVLLASLPFTQQQKSLTHLQQREGPLVEKARNWSRERDPTLFIVESKQGSHTGNTITCSIL